MSFIGPISSSSVNAAKAAAKRARALRKAKAASGLHASLPEQPDVSAENPRDQIEDALPHPGTVIDVPIRHAQSDFNFTPTFIAQLLGQLMPDPEQKRSSALSAYKELYARIRACDRLL